MRGGPRLQAWRYEAYIRSIAEGAELKCRAGMEVEGEGDRANLGFGWHGILHAQSPALEGFHRTDTYANEC